MALSNSELSKFNTEQLNELQRMNTSKLETTLLDSPDIPEGEKAAFREKMLDRLAKRPPEQIKARVNIDTIL